jgi:hypothetical protein
MKYIEKPHIKLDELKIIAKIIIEKISLKIDFIFKLLL